MKKLFFKENRKQLIILISTFALINAALSYVVFPQQGLWIAFQGAGIAIPFFSLILGVFIALIPYDKRMPKERWLGASVGCMFILESLLLIYYSVIISYQWIGG